ncbi:MAG: hypothetical protein ACK4PR_03360 [Gammaproteobacteria bacterium]
MKITKMYHLHQDAPLSLLKSEVQESLLTVLMMYEVLQNQTKYPLVSKQYHFVKLMRNLSAQILEQFCLVYQLDSDEIAEYLAQDRLYILDKSINIIFLHNQMMQRLSQLEAANTITVNELLDDFDSTSANVLVSAAQHVRNLIYLIEELQVRKKND